MSVRRRHREGSESIFEVFSDMALLMLAAFVFMFALVVIYSQGMSSGNSKETMEEIARLRAELAAADARNAQLQDELNQVAGSDVQQQIARVLKSAGVGSGRGKRDFDLFISGLKKIPGHDLHMVVDATGSMHGVTAFLIPVLRVIAIRSGKQISAVSWYADRRIGTFHGTTGAMFDQLLQKAPFVGADETIGHTFDELSKGPQPGAYMLIGDEPPTDVVHYHSIPRPVFTLPLAINDPDTEVAFQNIAKFTGGRMLKLQLH
ncbi:MAG: hypothetical protein D6682_08235 [Zetaproteobacteria bacterium]|nr:MAG: hypothetical protein D6682_08235 [Zetaproteobacteria bacterium]